MITVSCVCHISISPVACIIANFMWLVVCLLFLYNKKEENIYVSPPNLERSCSIKLAYYIFLKIVNDFYLSYLFFFYNPYFFIFYSYPLFFRFSLEWINNLFIFLRVALEWMANWCLPNKWIRICQPENNIGCIFRQHLCLIWFMN